MAKLLIADDEPKLRDLLANILTQDGVEIVKAASGEEALKLIVQDPPNLVIADVKMPGLNGLELLQQIRARNLSTGVFLLTGYDDDAIEQQAKDLGALGIIHKPPMFAEVRQLIRDALAKLPPA